MKTAKIYSKNHDFNAHDIKDKFLKLFKKLISISWVLFFVKITVLSERHSNTNFLFIFLACRSQGQGQNCAFQHV